MADTVDTAIYKLSYDTGNSVSQLNSAQKAADGLVVSTEKLDNSTRTTSTGFDRMLAKYDPIIRAEQQRAKALDQVNRFQDEGIGTSREHASLIDQINTRYAQQTSILGVTAARHADLAKSVGLSSYEMINLSRQIQDVGVSLASGQSPLIVAVQQGVQIYDVFAASQGTVKGFFDQVGAAASRWITPMTAAIAAATAFAATAVYAATSWASAQREIDVAMIGIAKRSGVTASDINGIATANASATGLSISEARGAALDFAKTGVIYKDNINALTGVTHNFATAAGIDASDAAKTLAKALADPTRGAEALDKQFGFLDGKTLEYIRTLQNQNKMQEAQAVLIDRVNEAVKNSTSTLGFWAKAWTAVGNAASDTIQKMGQKAAGLGGLPDQEQLAELTAQRDAALQRGTRDTGRRDINPGRVAAQGGLPMTTQQIDDLNVKIGELEKKLQDAAKAAEDSRFRQFGIEADAAVRSLIPQIAQVENLEKALADLKRAQADTNISGTQGQSSQNDAAIQAAEVLLRLTKESADEAARHNTEVLRIAGSYRGVSTSTALILASQRDQLNIAKAVTGAEQMRAQELAKINELMLQGKSIEEATLIAARDKEIAVARATASVQQQTIALNQQTALIEARARGDEESVLAAQAYANAIRSGADETAAAALSAATLRNAMAKTADEADRLANSLSSSLNVDAAGFTGGGSKPYGGKIQGDAGTVFGDGDYQSGTSSSGARQGTQSAQTSFYLAAMAQSNSVDFWQQRYASLTQDQLHALANQYGPNTIPGQAIRNLITAVESNTEATQGNTLALSPFYTQQGDHLLGYRGYSNTGTGIVAVPTETTTTGTTSTAVNQPVVSVSGGGVGTSTGTTGGLTSRYIYSSDPNLDTRARHFATGGIAYSPTNASIAENAPEAVVPLAGGSIPVKLVGNAKNDNQAPIYITQNFFAEADRDDIRQTSYQAISEARRAVFGAR